VKRLRLLLACALCLWNPAGLARDLVACGHPDYPPVSWIADGRLQGLAPALVSRIFGHLGHTVRFDAIGNWKRCLLEVGEGRADIVVAAYHTREREDRFAFSTQYLVADPISLFVRRDRAFPFGTWDDLLGHPVGLLLGDSFGDRFDRYADEHLRVERVSSAQQNFGKLVLGRIDFMPIGLYTGELQRRRLGYAEFIERLPRTLVIEHYYLAVRKGSDLEGLLPRIDRLIERLHADGTIARWTAIQSERYLVQGADEHLADPVPEAGPAHPATSPAHPANRPSEAGDAD
jgi:polar amino acid transport system substrate-binding protein